MERKPKRKKTGDGIKTTILKKSKKLIKMKMSPESFCDI